MKTILTYISLILSITVLGQSNDTLTVKSEMNGEWEFQYFLDSTGAKSDLRFGPQENDSSVLIQTLVINENQIKVSEAYKLNPSEKIEYDGFWHFWHFTDGVYINIESGDLLFEGIYEVKEINENLMVLIECDKHDDCDELYFKRK